MKNIGSTWGKWDFHVHTPYSILNNRFGFDPFDPKDNYHETEFDQYVITLFTKAIENDIVAIGITDYFMIEGYKRIKEKYLDCPEKLEKCFPDESIRNKVKGIYVFPNIEFRIQDFVGEKAHAVNYHVIFSGDLPIQIIEENFLHNLHFEFGNNSTRSLTLNNIIAFGESTIKTKGAKGSPLLVGLENITVSADKICERIKITELSKKFIIAIPVDEDFSEKTVPWNGRDYTVRRTLYYQANCYMTSNPRTREWALAEGDEESRITEFGSIKPCIWGSDAHSYEEMFMPSGERHCWIKAQPSFEGLLQILYEPATRVMIQKDIPYAKDIHQLIHSIRFDSPFFPTVPIELNDSLVCIIGGKSTGKSLLLRNIAYAINSTYAKEQEDVVGNLKPIDRIKATVLWQDGTSDSRKIVYIPQTYLNRTIDDPEKETAIDTIIADVLHQEPKISVAYTQFQNALKIIKGEVFVNITLYEDIKKQLDAIRKLLLQEGRSATFIATIEELEKQRKALADKVNITQDEIDKYSKLKEKIEDLKSQQGNYTFENTLIELLQVPVVFFHDLSTYNDSEGSKQIRNQLKSCPTLIKQIEEFIKRENPGLSKLWEDEKKKIIESNNSAISQIEKELSEVIPEFELLKQKVEQNEQLRKIAKQIAEENSKLQTAKEHEEKEVQLANELKQKIQEIASSQKKYYQAYLDYCTVVNEVGITKSTELSFSANAEWRKKAFVEFVYEAFDNRYFTAFNSTYSHIITNPSEEEYNDQLLTDIWKALLDKTKYGELHLKGSYTLKTALERLFDDWYNIHYTVTSGNDTIADMSPGKKALALLELLISLKDTQCPILIDQPEDDLDNRSIYNELVRFIKDKKCERQIIVVTHNANVVLGADAEQVIIANQAGKDTPNNNGLKFEYRSGAIEDNECEINDDGTEKEGILSRKGIQTQICDILEGGKPALELRRNKYTSNNHTTS